jgi:hypothetical protein
VQETTLAWALAHAAKPHMSALEHNYVFVSIGAGDTFAAVHNLLKVFAIRKVPLRPDLVQHSAKWLDTYRGHKDQDYLRRLIEDHLVPRARNAAVRPTHAARARTAVRTDDHPRRHGCGLCGAGGHVRVVPPSGSDLRERPQKSLFRR